MAPGRHGLLARLAANHGLTLLMIIAGGLWVFTVLYLAVQAVQSRHWPTAAGRITLSVPKELTGREDSERIRIEYVYEVDRITFTGTRVRFVSISRPKEVETYLARYSVGKQVRVYYKPGDPSDAVLEPGLGWLFTCGMLALGLFPLLAGVSLRRRNRQQSQPSAPDANPLGLGGYGMK